MGFEARVDHTRRPESGLGIFLIREEAGARLVLDRLRADQGQNDRWRKEVFISSWSLGETDLSTLSERDLADLGATIAACLAGAESR
jgi:hypothetical protein